MTSMKSSPEYRSLERDLKPRARERVEEWHRLLGEGLERYKSSEDFKRYQEELERAKKSALEEVPAEEFSSEELDRLLSSGLVEYPLVFPPAYPDVESSPKYIELSKEVDELRKKREKLRRLGYKAIKEVEVE